jgi:hypothetical protein
MQARCSPKGNGMKTRFLWGLTCTGLHAVVTAILVFLKTYFFLLGPTLRPLPAFVLRLVDFPLYSLGAKFTRLLDPVIQFANETVGLPPLGAIFVSEAAVVGVLGGAYYFLIGFLIAHLTARRRTPVEPHDAGEGE